MIGFGTFLLMQSPSAQPSEEMYARAIEIAQAAETLGFRNIWVTAQSPASVEATVRRGFNLLTGGFGVPIERLAEFRTQFDCLVAEVKPPRTPEVGVQRAVYVTDNDADARAAAEEARWNMRVTLSLRNHYERVERGRAIPVPMPREPETDDLLDRF